MKLLSFILSIVILVCACIPCTEGIDDCNGEESVSGLETEHSDEDTDTCSPICICSCCSGFSNEIAITQLVKPIQESPSKPFFPYKESDQKDIAITFWQPPKIV